jgi:uncharacterized protein (DUF4415 family)
VLGLLGDRLHAAVITMRADGMQVISFRKANVKEMRRYEKQKDDRAARPGEDNPEWTAADIKKARPALELVSEVFGNHAASDLRRGRGRPPKEDRKVNQTLRIDPDVLEAYRREGKGWQTRINVVLRKHMPKRKAERSSVK